MPETHHKSRPHPAVAAKMPSLSKARDSRLYIKVRCQWCNIVRLYQPGDLLAVLGDDLIIHLERKFRCLECSRKDYMEVIMIATPEPGQLVRELVEIKTVKRPVWRDKRL